MTLQGKIFHTSWGYDMTINEYVKVLEDAGKATVKCIMVAAKTLTGGGYRGQEEPNPEHEIGTPFRLYKRNDGQSLVGSYPFMAHHTMDSKRKGYFHEWSGKPSYYNNVD